MSVQISLFGRHYVPDRSYKPSKKRKLELEKEHGEKAEDLVGRIRKRLAADGFELGELKEYQEASFPGSWDTLLSMAPFAAYLDAHGAPPRKVEDLRSPEELKPPFRQYPLLASLTAWRVITYGVPLDFADVRADEEDEETGFVSSVRLLAELNRMAPSLRLDRDAGEMSPEASEEVCRKAEPFGDQAFTWQVLRWFARVSVDRGVLFLIS